MSKPYQTLGEELAASWREAARNMNATIARMRANIERMRADPYRREEVWSRIRYQQAVAREREKGRAFVKAEAARVRRELGLPPLD